MFPSFDPQNPKTSEIAPLFHETCSRHGSALSGKELAGPAIATGISLGIAVITLLLLKFRTRPKKYQRYYYSAPAIAVQDRISWDELCVMRIGASEVSELSHREWNAEPLFPRHDVPRYVFGLAESRVQYAGSFIVKPQDVWAPSSLELDHFTHSRRHIEGSLSVESPVATLIGDGYPQDSPMEDPKDLIGD